MDLGQSQKNYHQQVLKLSLLLTLILPLAMVSLSSCQLNARNPFAEKSVSFGLYASEADRQQEQEFLGAILSRMTLQEKVAQMIQAEIKHISAADITKYGIGSILSGGGSHPDGNKYAKTSDWRKLADDFHQASIATDNGRTAIPVVWGIDAVHGHNNVFGATVFPHNIGLGAANNPDLTHAVFEATASDVRATGIKWVFSPTVAVARDDRWGRTYESFSEDPEIVSEQSSAAIIGLQGISTAQLSTDNKVISTSKHFIGDGGTTNGVDQGNTEADELRLLDIHGQSFLAAINAGSQTVMASFNSWNGSKVHGNKYLLTDLLKNRFGFDGFVIGDWNGHAQIPGCSKDSCAQAINAGVDMLMAPEDWEALLHNTVAQVESGEISIERINDAVTRILRIKYRAGLFSSDYNVAATKPVYTTEQTRAIARRAVRESLVLLKNNNSALPLKQNGRLLVIGEAADSIAQQSGGWTLSWQGDGNANADFPNASSILEGIREAVSPANGDVVFDIDGSNTMILENLQDFDAAIVVFGEDPYAEGAGDLTDLHLPTQEHSYLSILDKLSEQGLPVVSVMIAGRPLSTSRFINRSDAFVMAWLPGTEGAGIADVLIGDKKKKPRYDFSGKLAFSWPNSAHQFQINNYPSYDEPPLFSVGYGLSYEKNIQLGQLTELDAPLLLAEKPRDYLPIFIKKAHKPWTVFVGSEENWGVVVDGNKGATLDSETVIVEASDQATQEDARRITWTQNKRGQFYFQHEQPMDLSAIAEQNGQLKFKVKIQTPPKGNVSLRMDCHYPCAGELDITQFLHTLPEEEWQAIAIDLACFANRGAELNRINTPFLISANNPVSLELSDILIEARTGDSSAAARQIECSNNVSQLNSH